MTVMALLTNALGVGENCVVGQGVCERLGSQY